MLALFNSSMDVADIISTLTYAVVYPIAIIASTLYYLAIGGHRENSDGLATA